MCKDGGCACAIADDVAGLFGGLTQHLGAEILFGILQVKFLGDGDPVVADDWRSPCLLDQHGFRLRAERHAHCVGKERDAPRKTFSRAAEWNRTCLCHFNCLEACRRWRDCGRLCYDCVRLSLILVNLGRRLLSRPVKKWQIET